MAQAKRDVHVVPNHSNGKLDWTVKREGAQRASGTFSNKPEAMAAAKQIAVNNRVERIEHNTKGVIRGKDSFGNDPRKSKG
jgi:hypothetical protein